MTNVNLGTVNMDEANEAFGFFNEMTSNIDQVVANPHLFDKEELLEILSEYNSMMKTILAASGMLMEISAITGSPMSDFTKE